MTSPHFNYDNSVSVGFQVDGATSSTHIVLTCRPRNQCRSTHVSRTEP